MARNIKRIVSLLVSLFLMVSSMSVGFSAFAAEVTSLTVRTTETIVKNEAEIGTATHYEYTWNPQKNWDELQSLASEGTEELQYTAAESDIYTSNGDGTYSSSDSASINKILNTNGVGDGNKYTCENGSFFAAEYKTVYQCSNNTTHVEGCDTANCASVSAVTKQHGWDASGYYYYDYWNEDGNGTAHTYGQSEPNWSTMVKLRDESVTAPMAYEAYTYTLPRGTVLKDIVIANSTTDYLRSSYYEIYATSGKVADLYNAENLIATYDGEVDKYDFAFASHYSLNEAVEANYVGLKLIDPVAKQTVGRQGTYYNAARIWMLKFYGTNGVEKATTKTGALASVIQTTESEDNYSIPKKFAETDASYQPGHIYYRNGTPWNAGATVATDGRLWDRTTSSDAQFQGFETDASGNFYEGTHTELFYDLGDIYEINEIIFANHTNATLRASDMTFYASNNFEDLFTAANELSYVETNVAAVSVVPKETLKARYVGISFGDTNWGNASGSWYGNDYLRVCEFDVMGKYSAEDDVAEVTNYSSYADGLAAIADKASVVAEAPDVYLMRNGERIDTVKSDSSLANLYNGVLDESDLNDAQLAHVDAEGNYIYGPDVYTAFKYDLKVQRNITDVFLGNHDNSYYQATYYKVYVSDDETIDESDFVARVSNVGRSTYFNKHASLISMPEGTEGRYVEVRIFQPTKMLSDGQDATYCYFRLKELNIYGDMGYSMTGKAYVKREEYFTLNADNIANSLIANTPVYKTENIGNFNFGSRTTNTSEIYKNTVDVNSEKFAEASKSFTETTYYDVDGDWAGVSYTNWIYGCTGGYEHAEGCDETCEKTVEVIDDGSVYQTLIYKFPAKAEISEVDIYHSNNNDRLTSRYLLSFADKESDLFTENATKTIDVVNTLRYYYNLVELNEPVTAKYFAVRIICGVQPDITSALYNYGRLGHVALVGESLECTEHTWEVVSETAATCTEAGAKNSVCSVCGAESSEVIDALGHTESIVPAQAPTCTEDGYTAGKWCPVCNETYEGKQAIPAKGHTAAEAVKENVVAAICTAGGSYDSVVYCADCGEELSRTAVTVAALGHTPEVVKGTEADCTNPGLTEGSVCSVCGEVLTSQEVIEATGHNKVTLPAVAPTCAAAGCTEGTVCSKCGEVFVAQEEIPALEHTKMTVPGTPADCENAGFTYGIKCSVCGETIVEQEVIPASGHAYSLTETIAPTCVNSGSKIYTCSNCGDSYTETIPATGLHDTELVGVIAPTPTVPGYTGDEVCKICGTTISVGSEIAITGSPFINAVTFDGEIDCTNREVEVFFQIPEGQSDIKGIQLKFQLPDGFTIENVASELPNYGWILNVNLKNNNLVVLEGGSSLKSLEEVATPDNSGKYHILTLTLGVVDGVQVGEKTTKVLVEDVTTGITANENSYYAPAVFTYNGHTEEIVPGTPATCTETGISDGIKCSVCGKTLVEQEETPFADHDWQVDKEREVKYCGNEACNTAELPVYIVTFYGRNDKIIYEAAVDVVDGVGYLTNEDIEAANALAPYVYGYTFIGWDDEVTPYIEIYSSYSISAIFRRDTTAYHTVLVDEQGNVIDAQNVEYDQRFVANYESATAFLIDGQIVGGEETVTLYGCGELEIVASTTVVADGPAVSIVKTITEVIDDANVYRVFVHLYNPEEAEVSKLGVIFAPDSSYVNDESFTIEALGSANYITLDATEETNNLLASFSGIKSNVSRVVRAYANIGGSNIYSAKVDKHTFG